MTDLPDELEDALRACGALDPGERVVAAEQLTGGVSSDIWRIETATRTFCAKRALARLKVAQVWEAPVERNRYEAAWYRTANRIVPGVAPEVLAESAGQGVFAMSYLPLERFSLWKAALARGGADAAVAAAVGSALGRIHAGTANDGAVRQRFATTELFEALRLSPYLRSTAERHPDLAEKLHGLADRCAGRHVALVHGDVSPKNILFGEGRVVLLDAECAWYGDPAFDPAFCLNHLLLKSVWVPDAHAGFQSCFAALLEAYVAEVSWAEPKEVLRDIAAYLPALMLARIDGKSPVEYITNEADKARVRSFARRFVAESVAHPQMIADAWDLKMRGR